MWKCDLVPSAAGRDCQRAEAGIQQWSSISGLRGAAVDNSPFCSLLSAELLAPHTEASVLVGNRIKKKTKPTTTKPLRANLCHPAYKPRDGQLSSARWCVALCPAASLEVQADAGSFCTQDRANFCGPTMRILFIRGWYGQGQWSKLHRCIGQSPVMIVCPQS